MQARLIRTASQTIPSGGRNRLPFVDEHRMSYGSSGVGNPPRGAGQTNGIFFQSPGDLTMGH